MQHQRFRRRLAAGLRPIALSSLVALPLLVEPGVPRGGPAAVSADSLRIAVARVVAGDPPVAGFPAHRWRHVRGLYRERDDAPIWLDEAGAPGAATADARVTALVDALADAPAQGLPLDAYPWPDIRRALTTLRAGGPTPDALASADVVLTAAFVAYAEDVLTGHVDPRTVSPTWHIDPQDVDVDSALTRTLRHEGLADALALLRPQDPDYGALTRSLDRYRGLVADGGWPRVPDLGVLRPGDVAGAGPLGALLARLHAEGYVDLVPLTPAAPADASGPAAPNPDTPVVYDTTLAGAVAAYQARHGLVVDSVVGPHTLASLDVPAAFRMRQIAANLERHRWMPRVRGDRYVLVNVPAFRLRAYDGGRAVLSMKVVVGAEYGGRSTPVFSDSMAYVVFRPYWNVPAGIAERELWPAQRRDPSYFGRHGYEVVHASWGTYVRQRPGPGNALGEAKFIFPNDFNIYLHDTPAQGLFDERVRAFSHGCIRVERPDALARFALGPQGWDLARVRAAMARGADDRRVDLERKLPVYIVYFTAFPRDGELHFAPDVYDRDDALVREVRGAAMPAASEVREAAAARRLTGARAPGS